MSSPKTKRAVVNCRNKKRYNDDLSAVAAGMYASEQNNNTDLYVYKCKECRGYHLTRRRVNQAGRINKWIFNFNSQPLVAG